jgi:hypothetical protein
MDITFNPDTQYLSFKQTYIDMNDVINVYEGGSSPSFIIDPSNQDQDLMIYYWNLGYQNFFDINQKM